MPTKTLETPSTPRLSEAARHLVIPDGITTSVWPRVERRLSSVGVVFDPWQRGLGSVTLGCRSNGKYAATVGGVVASIPRQVGKTFTVGHLLIGLALEFPGLRIVWTSHHGRTTTNTFRSMQAMVRRKGMRPYMPPGRTLGIRTANGEQEIAFRNGSIIMFGAREYGFGRGMDAVDVLVFDESQILGLKALEDMVPATNQARHPHGALIFFIGTPPRPEDDGEAFKAKRLAALEGRATDLFFVEMSADEDADPDDRDQWRKANPSYPVRTPEESMLRMRANLGSDDAWLREAMGVWDTSKSPAVIDAEAWRLLADPASMAIERLALGIDVSPDRSTASVSLAGQRADELWHTELYEQRAGTAWLVPWVASKCERNTIRAVVIDAKSAAASLVEEFERAKVKITLTGAAEMAAACGQFFDAAISGAMRHTDQPQVNVSLSVARKRPLGDAWAWNRKSATSDITPVVAATLALWGAQSSKVKKPTRRVRAESRRAVVLA